MFIEKVQQSNQTLVHYIPEVKHIGYDLLTKSTMKLNVQLKKGRKEVLQGVTC